MTRFDFRFLAWAAGLGAFALVPLLAGHAGVLWEIAQLAGLLAALACIALGGAPVRAREARPATLLTLKTHSTLGWAALGAVLLHVLGLLAADRVVIEHLKLTAPLYQLAALGAGLILVFMVASAGASLRRRAWRNHRVFQAAHIVLGCLLLICIAIHVLGTARYAGGVARRWLLAAVIAGAVLMLLRARRGAAALRPEAGAWRRRLVFGRHSLLIAISLAATAAVVITLALSAPATALREPLLVRGAPLPLDFPHGLHTQVNCITCHHNFTDNRGFENCIPCHKSSQTALQVGVEARFHAFCFECHRHPDALLEKHGPVSGCSSCHRKPDAAPSGN
jgi:Class III cytochrome C family